MKTAVLDQATARGVVSHSGDDLPVIREEHMEPELAWIAMVLSAPSFTNRNGPLYPVNRAWSRRLMELYSLYIAGEMPAAAAATFQRVVTGNEVLRKYLAPLDVVWGTRVDDKPEMTLDEVESSYRRFVQRAR